MHVMKSKAQLIAADAEVERIMALSDDELFAEVRAGGEEPKEVAAQVRAILERAMAQARAYDGDE